MNKQPESFIEFITNNKTIREHMELERQRCLERVRKHMAERKEADRNE